MLRSIRKFLRTVTPRLLVLMPAGLLLSASLGGCWGPFSGNEPKSHLKDPLPNSNSFHIAGDAAPFGGPVPLKSKFYLDTFHASGDVTYHWNFDDGTISRERQPTHTFTRAGYYQVVVEVKDEKGHRTGHNLILGAWPPSIWKRSGKFSNPRLLNEVVRQTRRTAKRRRELKAEGLPFFNAAAYPAYKPRREPLAPGG
jgi:hypothetical protein